MEIKNSVQREYDPSHPNYERWKRGREISNDRAKFVQSLLSTEVSLRGLTILDIGSGEGGTSRLLSKNNFVLSLEPKPERIKKIEATNSLKPIMADCFSFPLKAKSFDLIILQDVIEHLHINKNIVNDLSKLLTDNGFIYISTPNRLSILNIISDPHWGLPFLSVLNRKQVKRYFLKYFRRSDYHRNDIAELFSLTELNRLFGQTFSIKIQTKYSAQYLLNDAQGLVWSKFHLRLVKLFDKTGVKKILLRLANDKTGIINKYFTPTFYLILRKK